MGNTSSCLECESKLNDFDLHVEGNLLINLFQRKYFDLDVGKPVFSKMGEFPRPNFIKYDATFLEIHDKPVAPAPNLQRNFSDWK